MTFREYLIAMGNKAVAVVYIRLGMTAFFKRGSQAEVILGKTSVNLELFGDMQFGETTFVTLNDEYMAYHNVAYIPEPH